ncbi:MAG: hypothetical protein ACW9W4_06340 [Candidatus Nitrosopumilus sp. bin_7KS]
MGLIASSLMPTHMSLDNRTPSEAYGITIQGNDKWKTLIERSGLG